MKDFSYHEPTTVKETLSLLKRFKGEAKIKAGGTDLLVKMKKETMGLKHLINLKNIEELIYINHLPKKGLTIGALTTLSEIEGSPIIKDKFNILLQSASKVASPQIRNRATIGGNICLDSRCPYYNQSRQWLDTLEACYKRGGNHCHVLTNGRKCYSIFSSDTVPALIVLNARVKLMNSERERFVPIEDFYTGVGMKVNKILPSEILTEIQIPEVNERAKSTYLKLSERGELDFPILGIAVLCILNKNEIFEEVNVAVIGMGPSPIKLSKIGELLKGQKFDSEMIQKVCNEIPGMVHPISNAFGWAHYKTKILPSFVARGITEATVSE
jgi:4-hydroxybenzoyl-CoA reductase subunit beta